MDDIDKLGHLIEHWSEHNSEHAKTYLEWSQKAGSLGRENLSTVLRELSKETLKLEGLFKKALTLAKSSGD